MRQHICTHAYVLVHRCLVPGFDWCLHTGFGCCTCGSHMHTNGPIISLLAFLLRKMTICSIIDPLPAIHPSYIYATLMLKISVMHLQCYVMRCSCSQVCLLTWCNIMCTILPSTYHLLRHPTSLHEVLRVNQWIIGWLSLREWLASPSHHCWWNTLCRLKIRNSLKKRPPHILWTLWGEVFIITFAPKVWVSIGFGALKMTFSKKYNMLFFLGKTGYIAI